MKDKLISIQGGAQYLQVQHRILWLREEQPAAHIHTDIVEHDFERGRAVVRATITIPDGGSATAYGSATSATLSRNKEKYIEWAETRAVGRALAFLGYSTAGAQDLDEDGPDEPVDAPLPARTNGQERPPLQAKLAAINDTRKRLGWTGEDVRGLALSLAMPADSKHWTPAQADELLAAMLEKVEG